MLTREARQRRRQEHALSFAIKNQVENLQTLQNELAVLQKSTSKTEEGTAALLEQRVDTQSRLDKELREQIRDLWEYIAAHTPAQNQMMRENQMRREQENRVEQHTNDIRALWLQGRHMRENIEAIHNLIAKFNMEITLPTPLANKFDI